MLSETGSGPEVLEADLGNANLMPSLSFLILCLITWETKKTKTMRPKRSRHLDTRDWVETLWVMSEPKIMSHAGKQS